MNAGSLETLASLEKFREVFHNRFDEVILLDTEYNSGIDDLPVTDFRIKADGRPANTGNRPNPVAVVAREVFSGREYRMFQGEFPDKPPYDTGPRTLFLTFVASAEYGTHIALGWPLMESMIDLHAEWRAQHNGLLTTGIQYDLISVAQACGLQTSTKGHKKDMRNRILRGGPWSLGDREAILDYCASDIEPLWKVFETILPGILSAVPWRSAEDKLSYALIRGQYMATVACTEWNGILVDVPMLEIYRDNWDSIKQGVAEKSQEEYPIYGGPLGMTIDPDLFQAYLRQQGVTDWPRTDTGKFRTDFKLLEEMCELYPWLIDLKDTQYILSKMKLSELPVGRDGRNRTMLGAFRATTGRNQPSSSQYIFGPAVWIRNALIQAPPGHRLIYADFRQQEFGIGAALSGDAAMWEAYCTGDFYLAFAKLAKALTDDANLETGSIKLTAKEVKAVRNQYKQCCLAILFGQGAHGLAARTKLSVIAAQRLIDQHKDMFPVFWKWSKRTVNQAMYMNKIWTSLGWVVHIQEGVLNLSDSDERKRNRLKKKSDYPNVRSLANFQMQAHWSDILRVACLNPCDDGLAIAATVHDAIMIIAPENGWEGHRDLLVTGLCAWRAGWCWATFIRSM
jgi:DNA polymerase I